MEELKAYTKYHFKHEEEYMISKGYRRLLSQKVAHEEFIKKIDSYSTDHIDENQRNLY